MAAWVREKRKRRPESAKKKRQKTDKVKVAPVTIGSLRRLGATLKGPTRGLSHRGMRMELQGSGRVGEGKDENASRIGKGRKRKNTDKVKAAPVVTIGSLRRLGDALNGPTQGLLMDAAAELGTNPVSKHQIQPEHGDEQADAGRDS